MSFQSADLSTSIIASGPVSSTTYGTALKKPGVILAPSRNLAEQAVVQRDERI